MANSKLRKSITSRTKGFICLAVLLAVTIFVSCLALGGMPLDAEGVNVLLPWVPTSGNWPSSMALNRSLGGGNYIEWEASLPSGAAEDADLSAMISDSVKVIRSRLDSMGETDASVTVKSGSIIRIETREMSSSRLSSVRTMGVVTGHFELKTSDEAVILTEKDVTRASVNVQYNNATRSSYSYVLTMNLTKEAAEALAEAGAGYITVTCDGDTVSSYATVSGDTVKASLGSSATAYNTGANMAFLLNTGAVDVTLSQRDYGTVAPDAGGVTTVVLIASLVLLLAALAYLILTGKLTGVSGFLTVWCALILGLFFYTTIVVPSIIATSVGCLAALLLGLLLAIFTAVTRTDAIGKAISEGSNPKQASKTGFREAAKTIWIVHGGAIVLSLLLMIFPFSRPVGYALAAMVVASAMVAIVMRAFQACFTAITNKASLFGKVK